MSFNWSIAVRKSESGFQSSIFSFQPLGERAEIGDAAAEAVLQPGIELVRLSFLTMVKNR